MSKPAISKPHLHLQPELVLSPELWEAYKSNGSLPKPALLIPTPQKLGDSILS